MLLKFFYDFILISSISTCICSLTASPPLLNIATTSLASLLLFFVFYADIVTSTITHRYFPLLRHRHFHHHTMSLHFNHHPSSLPTSSTSSLPSSRIVTSHQHRHTPLLRHRHFHHHPSSLHHSWLLLKHRLRQ